MTDGQQPVQEVPPVQPVGQLNDNANVLQEIFNLRQGGRLDRLIQNALAVLGERIGHPQLQCTGAERCVMGQLSQALLNRNAEGLQALVRAFGHNQQDLNGLARAFNRVLDGTGVQCGPVTRMDPATGRQTTALVFRVETRPGVYNSIEFGTDGQIQAYEYTRDGQARQIRTADALQAIQNSLLHTLSGQIRRAAEAAGVGAAVGTLGGAALIEMINQALQRMRQRGPGEPGDRPVNPPAPPENPDDDDDDDVCGGDDDDDCDDGDDDDDDDSDDDDNDGAIIV